MVICALNTHVNAETVLFSKDIVPVLEARCASCHMTGEEPGNMALIADMAHASLLQLSQQVEDMMIVQPGDVAKSYLILKLEGTHLEAGGEGARMPLAAPPLTKAQVKQIQDWIANGAPNN